MSHTKSSEGFTLIELLIATLLIGVVVTVFVSALLTMVSTATVEKNQLEMIGDDQAALSIIERDIRFAISFKTSLPSPFSDTYGPTNTNEGWAGTWTYKGSDAGNPSSPDKVLILTQNATTTNPLATVRTPVFIKQFETNPYANIELTYNCSSGSGGALTYNYKLPYVQIFFVRDKVLYRRTITDTSTGLCNGPQYQKTSCPAQDTTPAAQCAAHDEIIAKNVSGFLVTYYTQLDNPTPTFEDVDAYNSSDSGIFDEVDSALVTITMERNVLGKSRSVSQSIRVSRIN